MRHAAWFVSALLAACSSPAVSPDATMPDAAGDGGLRPSDGPPLEECFLGYFFADCGGEGPARLACSEPLRSCRWFVGGDVAAGFVASPCPASDVCCLDSGGLRWPFPDHQEFVTGLILSGVLEAIGDEPWDRTREVRIPVSLEPELAPDEAPRFSRNGTPYYFGEPQRGQTPASVSRTRLDTLIVRVRPPGLAAMVDVLEVMPESGATTARICRFFFSDASTFACREQPRGLPICASEGEVQISAFPESDAALEAMRVTYWARFPDGTETELAL